MLHISHFVHELWVLLRVTNLRLRRRGGSPWENGYVESLLGKLRDELLNGELFFTLREAQVLIEQWREHYNHYRPHSALGYKPPAPASTKPVLPYPQCA